MINSKSAISFILLIIFLNSGHATAKQRLDYNLENWLKWHKEYEQTVIGKGGWLSLAGLYWIGEGKNTLGSAKDNVHRFPDTAPAHIGAITIVNDQIIFESNNDKVSVNSKQVNRATLSVKDKTIVSFDNYEFYIIQREIGYAVRLIDNDSQKLAQFSGVKFTPFNLAFVLPAKLIPPKENEVLKIPTVYGTTREDKSAGWLEFTINGKQQRLQAVDYGKENLMYVMFSDSTSGDNTYGAGRYIEVEWPDTHGNTLIDFNRSYNPACAFTNYATCPLTPKQNRLKVAINAGELDVQH